MSDDLTAQFCAFTGLEDATQAAMFLEMAGGNLEMAVGLFFEQGAGGGDAMMDTTTSTNAAATSSSSSTLPDWFSIVWPSSVKSIADIPEAWKIQTLQFEKAADTDMIVALPQPRNGPCGVIAVIQAACLTEICLERRRNAASSSTPVAITDDILTTVLTKILWQARADDENHAPAVLVTGVQTKDDGSLDCSTSSLSDQVSLKAAMKEKIGTFKEAGGLALLLYSLVQTRTVAQLRKDFGDFPLVTDPLALCASSLLTLCLRGHPDGNVGAYRAVVDTGDTQSGTDSTWPLGFGLLSMDELETKIPIHNELKSPSVPVWVLHGGDHFTVAWTADLQFPNMTNNKEGSVEFTLYHWNGLPPHGPRLATLQMTVKSEAPAVPKTRPSPKHYKPLVGEIESLVQADLVMKRGRPHDWTEYRYEVQLASESTREEGVIYDARPADAVLPSTFDVTAYPPVGDRKTWRCAGCYSTRFSTMQFGMNDWTPAEENDPICLVCARPRSKAGWTVWMAYNQLPASWQRSADKQFAPKIVTVLRTKWPGAKIVVPDPTAWPST